MASANAPTSATAPADGFNQLLHEHLCAGYQCLFTPTAEEARLEMAVAEVARKLDMGTVVWSADEGFSVDALSGPQNQKYRSPVEALRAITTEVCKIGNGQNVFIFRDLDDFFADPIVRRLIRTLTEGNKLVNKRFKRPILLVSSKRQLHEKVKNCVTQIEFELPGEDMLRKTVEFVRSSIETNDRSKAEISPELFDKIVNSLRGLTSNEAENALSRCLVRHDGFSDAMIGTILDEKAQIIKKSEVLTYIPEARQATREEIGGFGQLMDWVGRRRLAYSREAQSMQIDYPKGVVLIGVPGTGKSYVAAAVARLLGLPGYIMDIGSVFGSLVGESEQRMRDAIRQIEAQQGCVLLLDEADKAFGGATDSQGDSGVTRRIFGQLLTWLSNKKDRTFVIMTLNRTNGIPPEFLRAGRFDAVWYTDLPTATERQQILQIHFKKRGVAADQLCLTEDQWTTLIEQTQQFVGAELEQLVVESRYISFERRGSAFPTFEEIIEAKAAIIPIATLEKEKVEEIRTFCQNRARNVSAVTAVGGERRARHRRSVDINSGGTSTN